MTESLRGNFLIAARSLKDPNFFQAVVLLVEHGDDGAMGLVVNRPSGVTVSRALEEHFVLPEDGQSVYIGGPVEPSGLFILHNGDGLETDEPPVMPGLYIGSNAEVFEEIVMRAAAGDEDLQFRVYSGCAGWGPDQLEGELSRQDWLILPGRCEYVFDVDSYEVWDVARHAHRLQNPLVNRCEGNPELN